MSKATLFIVDSLVLRRRRIVNRLGLNGFNVVAFERIEDAAGALEVGVTPKVILIGQAPDDVPERWRGWKHRRLLFRFTKIKEKARCSSPKFAGLEMSEGFAH